MKITQYERQCPVCNKSLYYGRKGDLVAIMKRNRPCRICSAEIKRKSGYISPLKGRKTSTEIKAKLRWTEERKCAARGAGNSFYGKKHSEETKDKQRGPNNHMWGKTHTDVAKNKLREHFTKNAPMKGRKVMDIWIEKYGMAVAQEKYKAFRTKLLESACRGQKNGMYGKPAPKGAGNGWSGWYKNFYFRSLLELSYIIDNHDRIISAEHSLYKINYQLNNVNRTYVPDFLKDGKKLVEIKPRKLWNTVENKAKFAAAREWCKTNNLEYEVIECDKKPLEEIIHLVETQEIKFLPLYKQKYDEYIKKYNQNRKTN